MGDGWVFGDETCHESRRLSANWFLHIFDDFLFGKVLPSLPGIAHKSIQKHLFSISVGGRERKVDLMTVLPSLGGKEPPTQCHCYTSAHNGRTGRPTEGRRVKEQRWEDTNKDGERKEKSSNKRMA